MKIRRFDIRGGVFLSLCLNILSFAFFLIVLIYKWDSITAKVNNFFDKDSPSESVLAQFNNEPLEAHNYYYDVQSDTTISVLFLGNSITIHVAAEGVMDNPARGMMSTCIENDYVHNLVRKISQKKNAKIRFSVINLGEFERTYNLKKFDIDNKLSDAENIHPDYLFVQIGENVSESSLSNSQVFHDEYVSLLNHFPDAIRIITIPFWPSKNKQKVITQVALDTESYLVDLSHLGNGIDSDNFASSEGDYKHPGVGAHPGDRGMENIANALFTVINAK